MKDIKDLTSAETALQLHITHSKPIELREFTASLQAIGEMYSMFVKENGGSDEMAKSSLCVEKVQEGSIIVQLVEIASAGIIPFAENLNTIYEFGKHLIQGVKFFTKGEGTAPKLSAEELKAFKDVFTITANDPKGEEAVSVIDRLHPQNVYIGCTFNSDGGNAAQNRIQKKECEIKEEEPEEKVYHNVLMVIDQMRGDSSKDKGNKARIESINDKKSLAVTFEGNLKDKILYIDDNPTKYGFMVDVVLLTLKGKPVAYKVVKLNDTLELE